MFLFYPQFIKADLFFRSSIKWNLERLKEYQNRKIIEVVRHAGKNVPYYRELFKKIGLDTEKFRGIDDLTKIPPLEKETLRGDCEKFCVEKPEKWGGGWTRTSGSTGTPIKLYIDAHSKAYKHAAVYRAYRQGGYEYFRKALIVQGFSTSKKEPFGFRPATNTLFFNSSRVNEKTILGFYPLLMKHQPKLVIGFARAVAQIIKVLLDNNKELPELTSIINYGENLRIETETFLQSNLNCKVLDFYSQSENAVMIHSMPDCQRRLIEDYFFPELFEDSGRSVKEGKGELIGTSFYNHVMPLIRYKTGDIIEIEEQGNDMQCSFRRVLDIEGRKNDMIVLPDGSRVSLVDGAFGPDLGIVAAQCIQEKDGLLEVKLMVDDTFRQENLLEIEKGFRIRIGGLMNYKFNIVEELEMTKAGKVPFIINRMEIDPAVKEYLG